MDDWGWKRRFITSSNSYAAAAVEKVYGTSSLDEGKSF
jgi:hypothetical protein